MNWREAYRDAITRISGMPAYPENGVPETVKFPWITYSMARNDFGFDTSGTLHTHHHTESEAVPNATADNICKALRDGLSVRCDEGILTIWTGSPEWLSVADQADRTHKHRVINVEINWLLTK